MTNTRNLQRYFVGAALIFCSVFLANDIWGQDSAFTYQGRLQNNDTPANGPYDFHFELFDSASDGSSLGILAKPSVPVSNGLFVVSLDYGTAPFSGAARWLEVSVSPQGAETYSILSPRHRLTATPYAIRATNVPASGIVGTLASSSLTGTYAGAVTFNNVSNVFVGDGAGLTNVVATSLTAEAANSYWRIGGNEGVVANRYIGTTDYQPIELRVNDSPAVRIVPTTLNWPNIISGASTNYILTDVTASSVVGGVGNGISDVSGASVVTGGSSNTINVNSAGSTIGGGVNNNLGDGSVRSVIAGGWSNHVGGDTRPIAANLSRDITDGTSNTILIGEAAPGNSFIGGGWSNRIGTNAPSCTIVGGDFNRIADGTSNTIPFPETEPGGIFMGGGRGNHIETTSPACVIVGGDQNSLLGDGAVRFIGGGRSNTITDGTSNTIIAGEQNTINSDSSYSLIGGGWSNAVTGGYGVIAGGDNNTTSAAHAVISGGKDNAASGATSTIAGGSGNTASQNFATIGGGEFNSAGGLKSFVGGGGGNQATGESATVGGGLSNVATGQFSTIPGGDSNSAALRSFAAGTRAKAIHTGVFVWADSTAADFSSTASDQFLIRASGGVGIGINNPSAALHVNGNIVATGTIIGSSDRNIKENFSPIDPAAVLDKVTALPILQWNYIGEHETPHIGPVAQDFYAAFAVGMDERHISMVDADGVALAAIQGLHLKLQNELVRREADNRELKKQNEALEERLEALEAIVSQLTAKKSAE